MANRPYQARTIQAIRDRVAHGFKRILVVLPTGGGKGYMAASVMGSCAAKQNDNIFFAAQRELIFQLGKQLDGIGIPYNTVMSGVVNEYASGEEHAAAFHCSLVAKDTLWARAFRSQKMELPPAKVVQIDEAHGSLSKTYRAIADRYSDSILIGWTATPCRTDGRSLGEFYDTMIQGATYSELQAGKFLVPVKVVGPDRPDLKGLKVSKGDYAKGALEQRMNRDEMVGSIVNEWKKNSQDRYTVLFAAGIQHSIHCRNEFRNLLGKDAVEHIDGTMEESERADIMARAADGRIKVLCNYGVLHTGVDVPLWKYLICARPTKSFSLWRQMGGRIQRPLAGHDHCMIQDHSDNAINFGYPDEDVEWQLNGTEKIEDLHREAKKKEKEKGDPYLCEKCKTVYRGPHCPSCGHKPDRKGEEIVMKKGELKELERKKANKTATPADKQKRWDECLGIAIRRRTSVGAAAHMYRDTFGVFPNNQVENVPRSSQWGMSAGEFYTKVVKPAKEEAKSRAQLEFEAMS
jgi:DNA repair protein RadD